MKNGILFSLLFSVVVFPILATPSTVYTALYQDPVVDELQPYQMANESAVVIRRDKGTINFLIQGDRRQWIDDRKFAYIYFRIDLFNASFNRIYFLNYSSEEAIYYNNELHYNLLETQDYINYTGGRWIFYTESYPEAGPNPLLGSSMDKINLDTPTSLRVLSHTRISPYDTPLSSTGIRGDIDFFKFTIVNVTYPAYMKITVLPDENGVWGTHDKFYINHQRINPDYIPLVQKFVINQGNNIPPIPNQGSPAQILNNVAVVTSVVLPAGITSTILLRKKRRHPLQKEEEREEKQTNIKLLLARRMN